METEISIAERRKWLLRLIVARLIVFTIFVLNQPTEDMLVLIAAVYALSLCWFALLRLNKSYLGQTYAQIGVDLLLITWMVNRTGGIDSYFSSLYFLEIVISSILLKRRGAVLTAALCSVIHMAHLDAAYADLIPSTVQVWPELPTLQYIISLNIFAFCVVAFLTNYLAERWRTTGAELHKSSGQVAFLQAFSDRIIHSMGSGLITTDLEGRIYLYNRAAEDITAKPAVEAMQTTIWNLFPGIDAKVGSPRFDLWTRRDDRRDICLRFSVSPVMIDERDTAGYVWCFDDMTELRLLERQMRQKDQLSAIGAMSAGIAHEIRNPLASITGSVNLLQSDLPLNSDQGRLVEIIMRETERLNRTITDFLSYVRTPEPRPKRADLSVLIAETVSLMRNSLELKPTHAIETRLEPVQANVDEDMMRQVFYNLANNAFKAMPKGGTLTISLEPRNSGAQIRFKDTGRGFSEDDLKKLFVPFHSSFTTGTGLGLPIVYQIVNAHNGTIGVKSSPGLGTTFFIDL